MPARPVIWGATPRKPTARVHRGAAHDDHGPKLVTLVIWSKHKSGRQEIGVRIASPRSHDLAMACRCGRGHPGPTPRPTRTRSGRRRTAGTEAARAWRRCSYRALKRRPHLRVEAMLSHGRLLEPPSAPLSLSQASSSHSPCQPQEVPQRLGHGPGRQSEYGAPHGFLGVLFPPAPIPAEQEPLPHPAIPPGDPHGCSRGPEQPHLTTPAALRS
jgi:hypothetical protein